MTTTVYRAYDLLRRMIHNDREKVEWQHLEGAVTMRCSGIHHQWVEYTVREFFTENIQGFMSLIPAGLNFHGDYLIPMSKEEVYFIMFF